MTENHLNNAIDSVDKAIAQLKNTSLSNPEEIAILEAKITAFRDAAIVASVRQIGGTKTAENFGLSPGRVSQIRKQWLQHENKTTPLGITQGSVKLVHDYGYMLLGDGDVVAFNIDLTERAYIASSTFSDDNCPVINLCNSTDDVADDDQLWTTVEFKAFPGWRFHSGAGGRTIAITLIRCDAHH